MLVEFSTEKNTDVDISQHSTSGPLLSRLLSIVPLFAFIVITALYFGWSWRDEYLLTAESGFGYALGILGGSMMLLLLIYPLRKRFYHSTIFILSTKNWFKLHMVLGVLGPLLILFHCNFGLGSTNSNVALSSMLVMVMSGLIGRFIYGKIHYGLYGKKAHLEELNDHQLLTKKQLDEDKEDGIIFISEAFINRLRMFERVITRRKGVVKNLFSAVTLGLTTRVSYRVLIWRLKKDQRHNKRFMALSKVERRRQISSVRAHITVYLSTIRKIAGLSFYERLFSLWHMLHLPIFFMLIITGFLHVYAVHTY